MKYAKLTALLTILLGPVTSLFGQADVVDAKNKYYVWATVGPTLGFAGELEPVLGGQIGINVSVNHRHFFQGRYYETTSLNGFPLNNTNLDELRDSWDFALLYGLWHFKYDHFAIIPSAGLSYGEGEITREYGIEQFSYLGVPLNLRFLLAAPLIGISADVYANLHRRPVFGMGLNLHLGRIKDWEYMNDPNGSK